jgi:hypothetical protein
MTHVLTYSLILAGILSAHSLPGDSSLRPVDLRCEYLKNPLGIDRTSPRLSWKLQAAPHAGRGLKQAAFQILVAAREDFLGAENGDLWDSGRVVSDESINVVYAGRSLRIAPELLVESPNLGPGWSYLCLERTVRMEHGPASRERLDSQMDRTGQRRRNTA